MRSWRATTVMIFGLVWMAGGGVWASADARAGVLPRVEGGWQGPRITQDTEHGLVDGLRGEEGILVATRRGSRSWRGDLGWSHGDRRTHRFGHGHRNHRLERGGRGRHRHFRGGHLLFERFEHRHPSHGRHGLQDRHFHRHHRHRRFRPWIGIHLFYLLRYPSYRPRGGVASELAVGERGLVRALEENRAMTWVEPGSGADIRVTPTWTFRERGRVCREYRKEVVIGGRKESAYGEACREPDGSWRITGEGG